jgi:diguanylate cyclase (GGDEF)-like protein
VNFSDISLGVFSAFALAIVILTARAPKAPGRAAFMLSIVCSVWWAATVVLRHEATDLETKIFFCEVAWLGIVGTPLFWSTALLSYAGFERASKPAMVRLIWLYSVGACSAALTNDWHNAIYTGVLDANRPSLSHGWLFYLLMALCYTYMLIALVAVLMKFKRASRLHRRQFALLIAAMVFPWISNASFIFLDFRVFNDDPTPFAFGLTAAFVLIAQARGKLLSAPPITRDVIFAVIPDPVIIMDADGRILEINPAAQQLPGLETQPVGQILDAGHPLSAVVSLGSFDDSGTAKVRFMEQGTVYEISQQELAPWGREGCRILVLRDVTVRENTSEKLAAASLDLQLRLEENLNLQKQLREEAIRDHLTGLYNRRHASEALPAIFEDTEIGDIAVAIIDLDHFKQINDQFGHHIGDSVLVAFAQILKDGLRNHEMAFRYGGEEFLIVMPGSSQEMTFARLADWRSRLALTNIDEKLERRVTFSAGVAMAKKAGRTLEACAKAADVALYRAKISGRNRDVLWEEDQVQDIVHEEAPKVA